MHRISINNVSTTSIKIAFSLIITSGILNASADTGFFRCGNTLVQLGDTKSIVYSKCGEPVFKDSFCKKPDLNISQISQNSCEQVEEWTYKPGAGQFITILRFEVGQLKMIRYGDRIH